MDTTSKAKPMRRCMICSAEVVIGETAVHCSSCGGIYHSSCMAQVSNGSCARCGAELKIQTGESVIRVWGNDADEVEKVTSALVSKHGSKAPVDSSHPW